MKTKEAGKQLERLVNAAEKFLLISIQPEPIGQEQIDEFSKVIEETKPAIKVLKNRFP